MGEAAMQITGMLYGSQLLKHVDFPATEVLGPGASEDEIQCLIDRRKRIDPRERLQRGWLRRHEGPGHRLRRGLPLLPTAC